jgi:hypothetical protein
MVIVTGRQLVGFRTFSEAFGVHEGKLMPLHDRSIGSHCRLQVLTCCLGSDIWITLKHLQPYGKVWLIFEHQTVSLIVPQGRLNSQGNPIIHHLHVTIL